VAACSLVYLFWLKRDGEARPAEIAYEVGRPLGANESTYVKYRQYHLDDAKVAQKDQQSVMDGMDTWYCWTGGNQAFWREISKQTGVLPVRADLLALLHSIPRSRRFEMLGTMNDPDCVAAEKPDQYGLMIDRMKQGTEKQLDVDVYGWSSGIVGLRLFKNPQFSNAKWNLGRYLTDPAKVEPPYLVGMACAVCHVSFNPLYPPIDHNEPDWHNLASMIGNQYLREGRLVAGINNMAPNQFAWHYIETQQPGTSETSRIDTDFINNPNAINSIYRLSERLKLAQPENITSAQKQAVQTMYKNMSVPENTDLGGTAAAPTLVVPHILKDGSDSMGVPIASLRVYVNIGSMHEQWMKSWAVSLDPADMKDAIKRNFAQTPFDIAEAQKDPGSWWNKTEKRMPALEMFAKTFDSYPLELAKEATIDGKPNGMPGKDYLKDDADMLRRGKIAFADKCARCHSSKKPDPMPSDEKVLQKAWQDVVLDKDFLKDNYLSDDQRHPISELGSNAARAMGTNPLKGNIWDNFSSETFKDQKDPNGVVLKDYDDKGNQTDLYNPFTGKREIKFTVPDKRAPSYRTPTLVSIWATGPYLHNNSVGIFTGDPSIAGRMAAFEDGMHKLLWPESRIKEGSVKRTTQDSHLPDLFDLIRRQHPELALLDLDMKQLIVPQGTPINLLMNVHPRDAKAVLEAYVAGCLQGRPRIEFPVLRKLNNELGLQAMRQKLLEVNQCPDFIEDKGHTYGWDLSPEDKNALIEFMKRF
jgi:hypothetical protein